MGYHDWNEEAMAVITQDLEHPWDALYQSIGILDEEVMSTVSHAMEWAVNHLCNIPIQLRLTNPFTKWFCSTDIA